MAPSSVSPDLHALLFPSPAAAQGLKDRARALGRAFAGLISPAHCSSCEIPLPEGAAGLCEACAAKVRWIGTDRCRRCGDATGAGSGPRDECPSCRTHPPAFIAGACAVARYQEGPVRDLVMGLKFGGQFHLAKFFARLMAHRFHATQQADPARLVIPVPPARSTWSARSRNHTSDVAELLARELKLKFMLNFLHKTRSTPPQATLSHEQRRLNLKDAFACALKAKKFAGYPILLVDDVITTGSTISECARTLHTAGLGEIRAISLARG